MSFKSIIVLIVQNDGFKKLLTINYICYYMTFSDRMEIEKNVLTDDSDTDYDCDEDSSSSDDEENFVRKIGNITTKTSSQGKIKIREALQAEPREDEEMDDFEAEMESELDARVLEAETRAAIANTEALAEPTGTLLGIGLKLDDVNMEKKIFC